MDSTANMNPVVVLERLPENVANLDRNESIALQKCKRDTQSKFSPLQKYGKVAAMTQYKCELCEDSVLFEHSTQFQNHLRETHELNQGTGECAVCFQEIPKDYSHIMCNSCVDDFARPKQMSVIHQCGSCNIFFVSERDLRDHVKEEHSGQDVKLKVCNLMHKTTQSIILDEDEELGENAEANHMMETGD